jgi:hypothetical protein
MTVVERSLATCLSLRGAFLRLWVLGLAGAAAAATEPLPANLLVGARLSEFGIRMASFANTAIVLAALVGLGAVAVREVGLHSAFAPRAHRHHLPVGQAFHWVQAGVLVGACVAAGQWLFDWWFWQALPSAQVPLLRQAAEMSAVSPLTGLLLHAVNEELMLRWGLMSGLLWVLALLFRQAPGRPKAVLAWAAILGVSVLSAAGQIPSLAYAIANDPAGILLLHTALAGAVAGIAYGWLFWKHGLEAAILAHVTAQAGLIAVSGAG